MMLVNIEFRWDEIALLLDRPEVQEALDKGMTAFCCEHRPTIPWDKYLGPWWYSEPTPDDWTPWYSYKWCDKVDDYMAIRNWDGRLPRRQSADWYRCWGACHWLTGWCCALGNLLMPDLTWRIIWGKGHSTTVGLDSTGIVVIFDILCGHVCSATTILDKAPPLAKNMLDLNEQIYWYEQIPMEMGSAPAA